MKIPVDCPVCGDVMLTDFRVGDIIKSCVLHPTHNIKLWADAYDNEVYTIEMLFANNPSVWAVWRLDTKELLVVLERSQPKLELPFFMPDLTDYPQLLEKIRTYIAFA